MIKGDKYLQTHANYFIKEIRLVAYRQYLESFKSVTIENMARSFGVSADFIVFGKTSNEKKIGKNKKPKFSDR